VGIFVYSFLGEYDGQPDCAGWKILSLMAHERSFFSSQSVEASVMKLHEIRRGKCRVEIVMIRYFVKNKSDPPNQ
jgi:hypothetical protein